MKVVSKTHLNVLAGMSHKPLPFLQKTYGDSTGLRSLYPKKTNNWCRDIVLRNDIIFIRCQMLMELKWVRSEVPTKIRKSRRKINLCRWKYPNTKTVSQAKKRTESNVSEEKPQQNHNVDDWCKGRRSLTRKLKAGKAVEGDKKAYPYIMRTNVIIYFYGYSRQTKCP